MYNYVKKKKMHVPKINCCCSWHIYCVENIKYVFQGEKKNVRLYGRTGEGLHLLYVKSRPKVLIFNIKHVCYSILRIVC